jgi:HD-GYP domain-containing protein (c-di-GMP phosphodiesterase class II)
MLIVSLDEVQPGMVLAAPVLHPGQPGQMLLKRGYAVDPSLLPRLRGLGVECLYVDYPGLEDLDRHLAAHLSPARQRIYGQIRETITAGQRRVRPQVSYTDYYAATRELVLTLLGQGQHPIYLDQVSRLGDGAVAHAAAVSHLALLLGLRLERYLVDERKRLSVAHAKEVVNLGVAGMLHDMGKLKLPAALQGRHATDAPEAPAEREEWESHARLGYELIHDGVEATAASAVLHHHQRYDGTGFPTIAHRDGTVAPLGERNIHVFARILMVVDLFDRLTAGDRGRGRQSNLEALHLMWSRYASWCDPVVLDALSAIAPPFPPGSRLGLSDGSHAVVVDVDAGHPLRPRAKRLVGDGMDLDPVVLDLSRPGTPAIESVGGASVRAMIVAAGAAGLN